MVKRLYTKSDLGLGQSDNAFPYLQEQTGSGKGIGKGFRTVGKLSGSSITDPVADGLVSSSGQKSTPTAPHLRINFDTIGQTIYRTIGHCRLALRPIWAEGIVESGDDSVSSTQSFAGALCAPIDVAEDGEIFSIWDGDTLIQNEGSIVSPVGWSDADVALLQASLDAITFYTGDEIQLPDPLIVADKGATKTNANRGIRYVVVPNYPTSAGTNSTGGSGSLPNLNFGFRRTNDGDETKQKEEEDKGTAVEFAPGSG